ncbi:MAG: hypothetical protein QXG39_04695 [Candidatus Aenigmatarchaeota archaeon]
MNWEKYYEELEKIRNMKMQEEIMESERNVVFPPSDEIALRHDIIFPAPFNSIENKNITSANLSNEELFTIRKVGLLINWLETIKEQYQINDGTMKNFFEEVNKDCNLILTSSVAKKGWLIENILNPKKTFRLLGERAEKKKLFGGKER